MKLPSALESLKNHHEYTYGLEDNDKDYLDKLRKQALDSIANYKAEKNKQEARKTEQEELNYFFKWLDNLGAWTTTTQINESTKNNK